jgi:hypothetical protein
MHEEFFVAANGLSYTISIDELGEEIRVANGEMACGSISLRLIEGEYPCQSDIYHITHLALEGCAGIGIGRRCLQLHKEIFDSPLTAGTNNGSTSHDGSHLTGNGPGFIAKMRNEGIVV